MQICITPIIGLETHWSCSCIYILFLSSVDFAMFEEIFLPVMHIFHFHVSKSKQGAVSTHALAYLHELLYDISFNLYTQLFVKYLLSYSWEL